MKKLFLINFLLIFTNIAYSAGTPAGTVIGNTAKIKYNYGSQSDLSAEAGASFIVDNKVNVIITSLGSTSVLPSAKNQPLLFSLTNIGNAIQRYKLEAGPVYSPENVEFINIKIYLDKDDSGTLTSGDILYVDPESFGDIEPDKTLKIIIVADVPDNLENGKTSQYYLLATTVDPGTKTETKQTIGTNTNSVDVVFADTKGIVDIEKDGKHSTMGIYTVKSVYVNIEKSYEIVSDPSGEGKPNKNAILRYILNVTVIGDATAEGVLIKDIVPEGVDYITGTIKLNDNSLSDAEDADSGYFKENTVFVNLGDMSKNTPKQVISFEVKIK